MPTRLALWDRVVARGDHGRVTCLSGGRVLVWFGLGCKTVWCEPHEVKPRKAKEKP